MIRHKSSPGELLFDVLNTVFMCGLIIACVYPFLYILFSSLSEPLQLMKHRGILFLPQGFSLNAYQKVLENDRIIIGFRNTLIYVGLATCINMALTTVGAFALSRKKVMLSNTITIGIVITMYFNGGLVPLYLVVKGIGLYNTVWAVLLPSAIAAWNLLITRTFFQTIPDSMEESAKIDGANDFTIFYKIFLPLSVPILAVITLFYAVGNWNSFFFALVFIRDPNLFPLQLVLREFLIQNDPSILPNVITPDRYQIGETIKYATIMVVMIPILVFYPFLQRYFVKGVMIGAIKQ